MNNRSITRRFFIAAASLTLLSSTGIMPIALSAQAAATQAVVTQGDTVYVVQRGDTLSAIARRYGTTVSNLMAYNGLTSTTIYVGQRVLIPASGTPDPRPQYPISYVVQRGDTLYSIAQRYGTTVTALKQVNGLTSDYIYVGQRLTISVATDPSMPTITHVVARGDTLSALARRYNVTIAAIKAANGLTGNTIYIGQRLLIPPSLGYPNEPGTGSPVILAPVVVKFAPGTVGTKIDGISLYNGSPSYSLRAVAGQTMSVSMTADNSATYLTVIAPGGGNLAASDGPVRNWSGTLPTSGDYIIQVINPINGVANFSLSIEIR